MRSLPHRVGLGDFDVLALYDALDAQRRARGLTWSQATRQMNRASEGGKKRGGMSVSTVTGLRKRTSVEGDGVLAMLQWLGRTPESFVPGHPAPTTEKTALPGVPPPRVLRWDVPALHEAINARRLQRCMTWRQVADEISGYSVGMLTGLATAERTAFPQVMRLVAWLDKPAVAFMRQASC